MRDFKVCTGPGSEIPKKNDHRHHGRMMGLKNTIASGTLSHTVLRAVSGYSRDGACFKLDNKHGGEKCNGSQKTISQNVLMKIL